MTETDPLVKHRSAAGLGFGENDRPRRATRSAAAVPKETPVLVEGHGLGLTDGLHGVRVPGTSTLGVLVKLADGSVVLVAADRCQGVG